MGIVRLLGRLVRGAVGGGGTVIRRVVDDRVLLLGLDELYRTAIMRHEREDLLACARRVAAALDAAPADVPVEGYYAEEPELTAYFRLMRALQRVPLDRASEVESLQEFRRLQAVTSSAIFGVPVRSFLLPMGSDPLTAALAAVPVGEWSVPRLAAEAARKARATDDCSLVGLAARAEDPVVLAALRESVVLYALPLAMSAPVPPRYEYVWRVDPALAAAARRFVETFNDLFGRELPLPEERNAEAFWEAFGRTEIVGRCVRLGTSPLPVRHYHWAVRLGADGQPDVHEFWHEDVITTDAYRRGGRQLGGQRPTAPRQG